MIEPQRAPVTPRVLHPDTGDAMPLEEAIPLLEGMPRGAVEIVGGPGSGKTTALRHLAAVWSDERVLFLDDPGAELVARESAKRFVVYTSSTPHLSIAAESLYLAPWSDDDLIEYLLAVHPDQCGSVMGRVSVAEHRRRLLGIPQLWRIALDEMAWDPSVTDLREPLRRAGLAGVDWEGVDLRDADMRGCSFHLGSSRSGLVDSPIAGEGSRTGFYTDDFDEQHYKSPEEIRKANLRGADLRGARTQGVDFYLVDLRDVRCTIDQMDHFRRSGAILYDRA